MYASMSMGRRLAPKCLACKPYSGRCLGDASGMDANTRKAFADNIRALREMAGLSQTGLAKRSGIAQTAISYCEQADGKSPTLETISALAKALRVPAWWLLIDHAAPDPATAQELGKLADLYAKLPKEGKSQVLRVAEAEARYHGEKKTDDGHYGACLCP
jgi:transcriptional regulator with XRE-family HTH domain